MNGILSMVRTKGLGIPSSSEQSRVRISQEDSLPHKLRLVLKPLISSPPRETPSFDIRSSRIFPVQPVHERSTYFKWGAGCPRLSTQHFPNALPRVREAHLTRTTADFLHGRSRSFTLFLGGHPVACFRIENENWYSNSSPCRDSFICRFSFDVRISH